MNVKKTVVKCFSINKFQSVTDQIGLLQLGSHDQIFPREFLYYGL